MRDFIQIEWAPLLLAATGSFVLVAGLTPLVLRWATNHKLFGPIGGRHIHGRPIVRLGGIAIAISILLVALFTLGITPALAGFYLGLVTVLAIGVADDLYDLPPAIKMSGQILAASLLIFFGSSISNLTNPFGGTILLAPLPDIALTIIWIMLIINSINLLDGMDGLASGISAIGAFFIAALSLITIVNQPATAQLAAVVFGACVGFLIYNWHPAKIFMGDGGSHVLGFALAALSIISGSKLATAALVLGLPIIDLVWAGIRRARAGRAIWIADNQHLHHQLLTRGLSQQTIVLTFYAVAILFGVVALAANTWWKIADFLIAIGLVYLLIRSSRQK